MLEEKGINTETVYVHLLNEGTVVLRPAQAIPLGKMLYRLLPCDNYDSNDECWEFAPGTIVKCVKDMHEDESIRIAKAVALPKNSS